MDTKRQNKLLKLAIGKLQEELEQRPALKQVLDQEEEEDSNTFLTEHRQATIPQVSKREKLLNAMKRELPEGMELMTLEPSHIEGTTA